MKLNLIFPVFPPAIDGIGDHTYNLAKALAGSAEVTVITGSEPHDRPPGVRTQTAFVPDPKESVQNVYQAVTTNNPDWILLQYNPFSYGKWGFNRHIPHLIRRIASRGSCRVALMIHEPCVPPESLKFQIMRLWQKRQLKTLIESADVIFFSITGWTREYTVRYPHKMVEHLPIGSNIPVAVGPLDNLREKYGIQDDDVLLGLFGSGHPNRLFGFVRRAIAHVRDSGMRAPLLYVGGSSQKLKAEFGEQTFIDAGKLSAEDVSYHLQAMDIYLCPFGKGVSSRRGSFMAGIDHALPCATTLGSQTDPFLAKYAGNAFLASKDDDVPGFCRNVERLCRDSALRERLGTEAKNLYTKEFQWDMIARKALQSMREVSF